MFFDIKILFQMLWRPLPARVDRGAEQLSVVNPIEDHQKTMKSATTRQFSDMLVPCTGVASQVAITVGIVQAKIKYRENGAQGLRRIFENFIFRVEMTSQRHYK